MKIRDLNLASFGPFSGRQLDFSNHDFQLVYGPNEGGKSSTLRAIMALLYGIPARTTDDFLHNKKHLRIGATLTNSKDQTLSFLRRKGTKGTILAPDGEKALPENALDEYLKGIEKNRFEEIHCINHEQFRAGGKRMQDLQGLADDSLLVASTSVNFPEIEKHLRTSVETLYAGSRRNSELRSAISEYSEAKKLRSDKQVSVRAWQKLQQEFDKQQKAKKEIVDDYNRISEDRLRLDRIRMALPKIAEWKRRNEELAGKATKLPSHYDIASREECQLRRKNVASLLQSCDEELCELTSKLSSIQQMPQVLSFAQQIELLQQDIGSQLKQAKERDDLVRELEMAERDVRRLLAEMGAECDVDAAEEILIPREQRSTIRDLAQNEAVLRVRATKSKESIVKTKADLERLENKLEQQETLRDTTTLSAAVKHGQRKLHLDEELQSLEKEVEAISRQAKRGLASLPLWNGTLDDLIQAKVLMAESVSHYMDQFAQIEQGLTTTELQIAQKRKELSEVEQRIAASVRTQSIPTEKHLVDVRTRRDKKWQVIRESWEAGEFVASLNGEYEERVTEADSIADRLRREADRVAQLAQQEERVQVLGKEVEQLLREQSGLEARQTQLSRQWRQEWQSANVANPRTPKEMSAWLVSRRELVQVAQEIEKLNLEKTERQNQHDAITQSLRAELGSCGIQSKGQSIVELLDLAQAFLQKRDDQHQLVLQIERDKERLTVDLSNLESTQEAAAEELKGWQSSWEQAMKWIGCQAGTTGEQANHRIDVIDELANRFEDWTKTKSTIASQAASQERFDAEVKSVCQKVSLATEKKQPVELAEMLHQLLRDARKAQQGKEQTEGLIARQEEKIKEYQQEAKELDNQFAQFLQAAGVKSPEQLLEVEGLSRITIQRDDAEQEVRNIAVGEDFQKFLDLAEGKTDVALTVQIEQLDADLSDLSQRRDEVSAEIAETQRQKNQIDGNDAAAHADQVAVNRLSQVHEIVGRFVRMKIAESILRNQGERYREENKDPLLAKASEYFAMMTCNEFSGLCMDYDEKTGKPTIVGIRKSSKEKLQVTEMSDGTRDPMFLALRLAYLQRRLGQYEPMPFIVDDILIHLDDSRALATLRVLVEISKDMQVLFFTHHDRLRELAVEHLSDQMTIHELVPAPLESTSPRRPK